jgi:Uma2 family endonuclease
VGAIFGRPVNIFTAEAAKDRGAGLRILYDAGIPLRMTAVKKPDLLSVEEYLEGEELAEVKHEYIGGTVHAMAGATIRHNNIAGNAFGFLFGKLLGKPCQPFNSDTKVRIELPDHTRFYYPDAMVVCQSNPETDHYQNHPVVVIEVLSDSTRRTDMGEKRDGYLAIASLKVLMLVEPDTPSVTVYRRQPVGGFSCELYEGLEEIVPLPEIEVELGLAEIYERVEFLGK